MDKRKQRLKDHVQSIHQKKENICPHCFKTYLTKNSLDKHVSKYHNSVMKKMYGQLY